MRQQVSLRIVAVVAAVCLAVGFGAFALSGVGGGAGYTQAVSAQGLTPIPTTAPERRTVSISGTGIVTLPPDLARFSVGITEQALDVMSAQATVATKTDAIITALRTGGIDVDKDVRTSNYSIQPIYDNSRNNTQTITGYRVSNQVNVTIRNFDPKTNRVGTLIDATVKAGANTVGSITFAVADPAKAATQAREDAIKDARAKAETLAKGAGATVGPVLTITETSAPAPASSELRAAPAAAATGGAVPPTAIQAGESSVTVTVSVVFTLQ